MPIERPDLTDISPGVRDYIEHLEAEIERLSTRARQSTPREAAPTEPTEPPTTINVITMTASEMVKRTPRHFYPRQRRAGMGIFDIETPENDPPVRLAIADESDTLLALTDTGSFFTVPVNQIPEAPVRGRGTALSEILKIPADQHIVYIGPLKTTGALAMVTARGYVRVLRHNYVGANFAGTQLITTDRFGPLVAANWTMDDKDEIFIGTEKGLGIRFRAKLVHLNGSLGIRLDRGDIPVAICGTSPTGGVFLLSDDGKGTIRMMEGFRSNKAPGGGGKIALKTEKLVAALSVEDSDDIFIVSHLSKVIRFQAVEIPPKTGAVQGVICMSLRADSCTGAII